MQCPGRVFFYMTMHMEVRPIHSGRNIIELPKKQDISVIRFIKSDLHIDR